MNLSCESLLNVAAISGDSFQSKLFDQSDPVFKYLFICYCFSCDALKLCNIKPKSLGSMWDTYLQVKQISYIWWSNKRQTHIHNYAHKHTVDRLTFVSHPSKTVSAHCKPSQCGSIKHSLPHTANMHTHLKWTKKKHNEKRNNQRTHTLGAFNVSHINNRMPCVNTRYLCSLTTTSCGTLINKSLCTAFFLRVLSEEKPVMLLLISLVRMKGERNCKKKKKIVDFAAWLEKKLTRTKRRRASIYTLYIDDYYELSAKIGAGFSILAASFKLADAICTIKLIRYK